MPVFDYVCNGCGHKFDEMVSVEDVEKFVPTCPECKSIDVRKKFSPIPFHFKGGGGVRPRFLKKR